MPLDGEQTYYQHAVEVNDDGSLVVYDNGNFRPGTDPDDPDNPPYSRAVIYEVDDSADDPADWSATQRWEHIDAEDNGKLAYSTFISDADVLSNGNVLMTSSREITPGLPSEGRKSPPFWRMPPPFWIATTVTSRPGRPTLPA